jgi:glyceraldehyde-3-phosphate dehydrogenase/erythrose-4-phosphate dehydrogenase
LVSTDILGDPHSAVLDAPLTMASGHLVKVMAWYDNEYGYACRMLDTAVLIGGGGGDGGARSS